MKNSTNNSYEIKILDANFPEKGIEEKKVNSLLSSEWKDGPLGDSLHISGIQSNATYEERIQVPAVYNSAILSDGDNNLNIKMPYGFLFGGDFNGFKSGIPGKNTMSNTLFDTNGLTSTSFHKLRGCVYEMSSFNYFTETGPSSFETSWKEILPEYFKSQDVDSSGLDWVGELLIQTDNFILEGQSFGTAIVISNIKKINTYANAIGFLHEDKIYFGRDQSKNDFEGFGLNIIAVSEWSSYSPSEIYIWPKKIHTKNWDSSKLNFSDTNQFALIHLSNTKGGNYKVNPFVYEYQLLDDYNWPMFNKYNNNFGWESFGNIPFEKPYFAISPSQNSLSFSSNRSLFIDNKQVDFLTEDSTLFVYKDKILNSIGEVKISDMSKIYGVDQVGRQWPNLTNYRTDDAVGMKYTKQEDSQNNTIIYQSDFDNAYPWSCIKEVSDNSGNVFIRIPKFYHKYTKNANGTYKVQISGIKHDDSWLTCFIERGVEIPYVDIGKYQASEITVSNRSRLESVSNKAIVNFKTVYRSEFKGDYGVNYHSFDVWNLEILRLLFLVEFATTDSNSIIKTLISITHGYFNTGTCDGILTGQKNANNASSCVYRGIENPWGNSPIFVDGISFKTGTSSRNIYISNNSQTYKDDIDIDPNVDTDYQLAQNNYLETGSSGGLKEMSPYTTKNFKALTIPSAVGADKTQYYCSEIEGFIGILTYGFKSPEQSSPWTQDIRPISNFNFLSCRLCHKQDIHIKTIDFVAVPGEKQYITQGLQNRRIEQLKSKEDDATISFRKKNDEITFWYHNKTKQDKTITLILFSTNNFDESTISINQII